MPWTREISAFAAPVAVTLFGLAAVLPTLSSGLWGPEEPFLNGDLNGGWWLWWAMSEHWRGGDPWSLVAWPEGIDSIAPWFPNPLQMGLVGLFGGPSALGWNLVQLTHVLLLGLSTVVLARVAGARPLMAACAGALVASSPVLLHEVSGGRPDDLIVWPGVLALAALWRGGRRWDVVAGLLAALQGLGYAWHGVALILVGLPLIRRPRDAALAAGVGLLVISPYLMWLREGMASVPVDLPPDGYKAMPLAGFWASDLPGRFLVHPLLLPAALLGVRGGRRFLAAGLIGVVLALGPEITWSPGGDGVAGPWAWVAWVIPPAARMHHPIREVMVALPLLATALALGLARLRHGKWVAIALLVSALFMARKLDGAAAYGMASGPAPFSFDFEGPAVDLCGVDHATALGFQTVHGQALVEGLDTYRRHPVDLADLPEGVRVVVVFDRLGDCWTQGLEDGVYSAESFQVPGESGGP